MVEQAIRTRLLANAGVIAVAGARGYMLNLPQGVDYPAFRVLLVDEQESSHHRGGSALRPARVQVDAFARAGSGVDPYRQAGNLARAINAALMSKAPFVVAISDGGSPAVVTTLEVKVVERESRAPMFDPDELQVVIMGQDFLVWSKVM